MLQCGMVGVKKMSIRLLSLSILQPSTSITFSSSRLRSQDGGLSHATAVPRTQAGELRQQDGEQREIGGGGRGEQGSCSRVRVLGVADVPQELEDLLLIHRVRHVLPSLIGRQRTGLLQTGTALARQRVAGPGAGKLSAQRTQGIMAG